MLKYLGLVLENNHFSSHEHIVGWRNHVRRMLGRYQQQQKKRRIIETFDDFTKELKFDDSFLRPNVSSRRQETITQEMEAPAKHYIVLIVDSRFCVSDSSLSFGGKIPQERGRDVTRLTNSCLLRM